jgi:outer membrane protein OmpA-like peptidoglycan-associated protein
MGKLDNYGKEIEIKINSDNQNTQEIKTKTDGNFSIQTPSGKVTITITAENMDNASKTLDIPKVYCLAEINISDIELKHNNTEIAEKNGGHQKNTFETINNTTIPTILFEFNKINADKYNKDLDLLANYLNSANNILVEIGGYADAQGDEAYNLMLSEKRANTIKNYLISKSVNAEKLIVKAYGEKYPVSININPKSRKYNRRVQFKIIRDEIGKLNFALPVIPDEYMIK